MFDKYLEVKKSMIWELIVSALLNCCSLSAPCPYATPQSCRNLTYYSVKKGKRKTVKAVTERFMRLHCGLWIRRKVHEFYSPVKSNVSVLTYYSLV